MQLTGRAYNPIGSRVQIGVGYASLVGACAFIVASVATKELAFDFAAIGPFIAGVVNLAVGSVMRKKQESAIHSSIRISPEAKQMMGVLMWKYVWQNTPWYLNEELWGGSAHGTGGEGGYRAAWDRKYSTQLEALPEQVLSLLESAAASYNRIQGMLEIRRQSDPVLERLSPKVSLAADETMADILHQSAMLGKFPESGSAIVHKIEDGINLLTEMSAGLERLSLSEPTFPEKLMSRTAGQEVLEELRLEQLARSELLSDSKSASELHENA